MGRGRDRQRISWLAAALLLLCPAKNGRAQDTPAATPWVQASPPPGATATPKPAATTPKPSPPKPPRPSPSLSSEDVKREMMRRRAEEERAQSTPEDRPPAKEAVKLEQLPPDEREAYERNLPLWRQLSVEERQDIRRQADERARQETDKAYRESGLALDHDQREVFDLRYRQERRRLERELQAKINAERTRRLVEITARLKQEFADKTLPPTPVPRTPAPTPALKPAGPTPPAANPDMLLSPGGGSKH